MSKILLSGEWLWRHYQEACADALGRLGHEAIKFEWHSFFFDAGDNGEPHFRSFLAQRQNKYLIGPIISKINRDLISISLDTQPDVIWLYNDTHILPRTIRKLKKELPKTVLAQYANDNPWGKNQSKIMWRHFRRSVPLFDINFFYRFENKGDLERAGARRTAMLLPYFIPEDIYHIERDSIELQFRSDVVFVGHYENDERLKVLTRIAEEGIDLKIFGTDWNSAISTLPAGNPLKKLLPIKPARGQEYVKAICGSRIALAFLSKLNEDTYTRRNFEIPAMKSFMLGEYTKDLDSFFNEGAEAEYFRSDEELLRKIRYYLGHSEKIDEIASNAFERVRKDGHDVVSRMRQFMSDIHTVRG